MAGKIKSLLLAEGITVTPSVGDMAEAGSLSVYATTAAYLVAKDAAVADGDIFYDSTLDLIQYYADGAWSQLVDDDSAQTLENKSINDLTFIEANDAASTGAAANITPTTIIHRLTNGSLTSIDSIAITNTQTVVLMNVTGVDISILNDSGTGGEEILTGTGNDMILKNDAALFLTYDDTTNKWRVVGGAGGGGLLLLL